jgi:hypothetical protein
VVVVVTVVRRSHYHVLVIRSPCNSTIVMITIIMISVTTY